MSEIKKYLERIRRILDEAEETQFEVMNRTAEVLAKAIKDKKSIFAFGTGHATIPAMELYYRTGGLVVINYIRAPGLALDVEPPTLTTDIERLSGYGKAIISASPIKSGDVLILHSVSGRNSVPVDAAIAAKKAGAFTICLSNIKTSSKVASRHESGKNLYQVCDLVIDNCGSYGDAEIELENFSQKVAPSSTTVGTAILNAIVAETVSLLLKEGIRPPVFISSNVPGGDEHNAAVMKEYQGQIHYNSK
jgi:uncharacterized phosphosugar-binding protein